MIDLNAQPNDNSVAKFISGIDYTRRQLDAQLIQQLMTRVSGKEAVMWGDELIGFGAYHYIYKTGKKINWPVISFHPGDGRITVFVMPGFEEYEALLKKLGKHKLTSNCLLINKLSDIDMQALEQLMAQVYADMQTLYPCE
jgi:hypothetical protein